MQKSEWFRRIADAARLEDAPLPGVPILELAGEGRMLIECHRGVTEYSEEQICVCVTYGCICIRGKNLQLRVMSRERLVITGRIEAVELIRRNGNV